jgi:uncharacterized membrane protein YraQ (UPF0718 family)
MWNALAGLLIAALIGMYLASFWLKSEAFWGRVHKSMIAVLVISVVGVSLVMCAEGGSDETLFEREYRGRR